MCASVRPSNRRREEGKGKSEPQRERRKREAPSVRPILIDLTCHAFSACTGKVLTWAILGSQLREGGCLACNFALAHYPVFDSFFVPSVSFLPLLARGHCDGFLSSLSSAREKCSKQQNDVNSTVTEMRVISTRGMAELFPPLRGWVDQEMGVTSPHGSIWPSTASARHALCCHQVLHGLA